MDRRVFMTGIGGAALCFATPRVARADASGNLQLHAILRVRFDDDDFQRFDGFQIQSAGGTWGRDWSGEIRVFNEDRADLGTVGGLLRRPFGARWAEARPIGTVYRLGSTLIGDAGNGGFDGFRATVGAGDVSWDLPRTLQPAQRIQGRGQRAGSMRLGQDDRILISLNARPAF